jgi:hypothetical protein
MLSSQQTLHCRYCCGPGQVWSENFCRIRAFQVGFGPRFRALSIKKGDFLLIFVVFYVHYSTLLHLPPLRFHCVGGRRMEGPNPGLLRLWHWQPDALTTRLDLIHNSAWSHPHSARSHPLGQISSTRPDLIHKTTTRLDLIHLHFHF